VELPDAQRPKRLSSPAPESSTFQPDPEGIGSRVSAVFTKAEQAAEHILQVAQDEADDIRRRAEAEMELYRGAHREAADREARELIDAARVEADTIRAQATDAGRATEAAARVRAQRIAEGVRLMIEQAEWARQGLSDALARLNYYAAREPEEWSGTPEPSASGEPTGPAEAGPTGA
jgi:cell division septum initiation protein DivIVA